MQIEERFEYFLEAYRRPDGQRWSGQDLQDATGGVITRSYVSNLRKGRIRNPGLEKLRAIARAMRFSPELWFDEHLGPSAESRIEPDGRGDIAGKVQGLFQTVKNRRTGDPYTDAEVSRMTVLGLTAEYGGLSEEEVRKIRTGEIPNPSVNHVVALADVFGVQPSYFLDARGPSFVDEEALEVLQDETTSAILHRSARLSKGERDTILGIIQQFEILRGTSGDR